MLLVSYKLHLMVLWGHNINPNAGSDLQRDDEKDTGVEFLFISNKMQGISFDKQDLSGLQLLFLLGTCQCFHFCFPECERVGGSNYRNYVHCACFVTNGEEQSTSVFFKQIQEICALLTICFFSKREVFWEGPAIYQSRPPNISPSRKDGKLPLMENLWCWVGPPQHLYVCL